VIPEFPVYLFDVDGTLVDSAADICGALHTVLANTPHNNVEDSYLRKFIGFHLYDLFQDLSPDISQEEMDQLLAEYRAVYPRRNHDCTQLYPGIKDVLASLGGRKSTATTKGTPTTRIVLEKFGLLPYFDHVQGTDGFPHKPEPDVIFASLKVFGARPEDCLLIGDASTDMQAGRAAGVKTCAVRWGYGNQQEMARWEPDYWIDDPRELLKQ